MEDPCDYDFELMRYEDGVWVKVATYSGGCPLGSVLLQIEEFTRNKEEMYRISTPLFGKETKARLLIFN